jgi:hypothetical protein
MLGVAAGEQEFLVAGRVAIGKPFTSCALQWSCVHVVATALKASWSQQALMVPFPSTPEDAIASPVLGAEEAQWDLVRSPWVSRDPQETTDFEMLWVLCQRCVALVRGDRPHAEQDARFVVATITLVLSLVCDAAYAQASFVALPEHVAKDVIRALWACVNLLPGHGRISHVLSLARTAAVAAHARGLDVCDTTPSVLASSCAAIVHMVRHERAPEADLATAHCLQTLCILLDDRLHLPSDVQAAMLTALSHGARRIVKHCCDRAVGAGVGAGWMAYLAHGIHATREEVMRVSSPACAALIAQADKALLVLQ